MKIKTLKEQMNGQVEMSFALRSTEFPKWETVRGPDETIRKLMELLFASGDYVFRFKGPKTFKNISPITQDTVPWKFRCCVPDNVLEFSFCPVYKFDGCGDVDEFIWEEQAKKALEQQEQSECQQ